MPLQPSHGEWPLTQYAMGALEALGLLKMDFLGLRTLTLIEQIVRLIERQTGKPFDVRMLPLDDEKRTRCLALEIQTAFFSWNQAG
ncbi:DNA polymerase III subunit alpha [Geobacillus sp. BCO2]|nr:DNA polymerase III subunit alpha [Geobacillus sp. BCO2]